MSKTLFLLSLGTHHLSYTKMKATVVLFYFTVSNGYVTQLSLLTTLLADMVLLGYSIALH